MNQQPEQRANGRLAGLFCYFGDLGRDIKYGLRAMAASPGVTAVALVSLGLGMCIPASMFSWLNGTIWRDIPGTADADELVAVPRTSYPHCKRYAELDTVFSSTLTFLAPVPFGISGDDPNQRAWGHLVTPSYFSTLGVRPLMGRVFDKEQELPGKAALVVVSHRFWKNHLGADPLIIGRDLRINGHVCTVIGVTPEGFLGAAPLMFAADLWMPLAAGARIAPELADNALERRDLTMFQLLGRLQRGVTLEAAEARLNVVTRQFEAAYGETDEVSKGRHITLWQGGKLIATRKADLPMLMVYPIVLNALILLIACANVANMMLVRAADRRREIAIRLSLGAGRVRLVRQMLTESTLLAIGAGLVGFSATAGLMHLSSQMQMPHAMPVRLDVHVDYRVLVFTVAISLFAGLALGLTPALAAMRTELVPALKEGGNWRLRRFRRLSMRNLLVLSQMVGSLTLLVLTGMIVFGYGRTVGRDVGFDSRNLHMLSLDPIRDGYPPAKARQLFRSMGERVKAIPGITAVAFTESIPMGASGRVTFSSEADAAQSGEIRNAIKYVVGREYFQTVGIPILRGSGFRPDEAEQALEVIVSEALARLCWPEQNAVGRRIEIGGGELARFDPFGASYLDYRGGVAPVRTFYVAGVARDVKESAMERAQPAIYFRLEAADYARPSFRGMTLLMRAAPGFDVLGAVQNELAVLAPEVVPFNGRTMSAHLDISMFPVRMGVWSYGVTGLFGLILASVGLAGVTAYSVAQRRREIGIRIALGASRSSVLGLVLKESAAIVTIGTVFGLAGAWAIGRVLSASLDPVARVSGSGVSEPMLVVGAPLLLAALALTACYVPARKSAGIDPVVTLRQD